MYTMGSKLDISRYKVTCTLVTRSVTNGVLVLVSLAEIFQNLSVIFSPTIPLCGIVDVDDAKNR